MWMIVKIEKDLNVARCGIPGKRVFSCCRMSNCRTSFFSLSFLLCFSIFLHCIFFLLFLWRIIYNLYALLSSFRLSMFLLGFFYISWLLLISSMSACIWDTMTSVPLAGSHEGSDNWGPTSVTAGNCLVPTGIPPGNWGLCPALWQGTGTNCPKMLLLFIQFLLMMSN